jgi:hypothetical protein
MRVHVGNPPYALYPRRARTPRHRSDCWSLRCAGGSTPVPSVASGPHQVAPIHRSAHRPWRAIGRRSGARRRPSHDLSTRARVVVVTSLVPNRPPAPMKTRPRPLLARMCTRPESRRSAIGAARCELPSSRHPHPRKLLSPSLCTTIAPRVAC